MLDDDLPPPPLPKVRQRLPVPPMPAEISKAIVAVMKSTGTLAKNEKNTHGGYKYASVDAFYEEFGPATAEQNLIIHAAALSHSYDKIINEKTGDMKVAVTIEYAFTLFHSESGTQWSDPNDTKEIRLWWSGAQTFGAGESYAIKQYMRGLFKIPTGDRDADEADQGERIARIEAPAVNDARRNNGRRQTSKLVAFDIGPHKKTLAVDEVKSELLPYLQELSIDQLRAWRGKNTEAITTLHGLDKHIALAVKELLEDKLG